MHFTLPDIAKKLIRTVATTVDLSRFDLIVEPSAGTGSFSHQLPQDRTVAIDIEPAGPGIEQHDFLQWSPPPARSVLIIGNPPFGRNSNLAIAFVNRAATIGSTIAFILPRTFRKSSVQRRLDRRLHVIHDEDVEPFAFERAGKRFDVPTCFMIFEKRQDHRSIDRDPHHHPDFEWTDRHRASFAIQRVGSDAGAVQTNIRGPSRVATESHLYVRERFERIDRSHGRNSVQPSLSRAELVRLYCAVTLETPR